MSESIYSKFARLGGRTKSVAKSAAARENGKRGGRPKKVSILSGRVSDPLVSKEALG